MTDQPSPPKYPYEFSRPTPILTTPPPRPQNLIVSGKCGRETPCLSVFSWKKSSVCTERSVFLKHQIAAIQDQKARNLSNRPILS